VPERFLQSIFLGTSAFLRRTPGFLQIRPLFLHTIFLGTSAFLRRTPGLLQIRPLFLHTIFLGTSAFLEARAEYERTCVATAMSTAKFIT
jgi:hypothetical protein